MLDPGSVSYPMLNPGYVSYLAVMIIAERAHDTVAQKYSSSAEKETICCFVAWEINVSVHIACIEGSQLHHITNCL